MSLRRRDLLALPLLLATPAVISADDGLIDLWSDFRAFAGKWSGSQTGVWGDGAGIRTIRFFINDSFLEQRTALRFPPQPANPDGDTRLDYGVVSLDRRSRQFFFRRYYPGGLYVEYRLKEFDPVDGRFVWVSERIENGTPDTKVELTVVRESADVFREQVILYHEGDEPRMVIDGRWERTL
ncbi:MAG: hypothetical protein KDC27_02755 [Acidobacteria bacterium]|nr:hypothetical protein [Acidobacteriota bacterium]